MTVIKIVPMPGVPVEGPQGLQGPTGQDGDSAYQIAVNNGFEGTEQEWLDSLGGNASTGNFVFSNNEMSTNEEMIISVNTVPGSITASAYNGLELQFADAPGAGLRFPDGSIQTTAYEPAESFIPLPEFLSYDTGRDHLPSLNTNFGWDAEGLWFGYSGEGTGTSYPVFTNFTINGNDAVTVEFNVNVQDECSDVGVCVYLDEDTPQWQWGTDVSRIAAQFDCLMPALLGRTEYYQGERINIPAPGMYRVKFTYNPIGGTPVQFEYYQGSTLVNSMTLNETLSAGNYRVGFASDNNNGKTYISDLSVMVNENVPYTDTLQNGNSGTSADIADFIFDRFDGESRMTIHNHDMVIRTTRDDNQDSDIDIRSADDVWITSNDTLELTSVTDDVVVRTDDGGNTWNFKPNGDFELPGNASRISSGIEGQIVVDSINATFYNFYNDSSSAIMDNTGVALPINAESMWFINNGVSSATVTFADATTIQTTAIYDATSQGTTAIIFAWDSNITKSFEEAFPMTIGGAIYVDNNYVALNSRDAQWRFDSDGNIKFPGQPSNQRTGSGEVLHFGNPTQQSIITGSTPTSANPTAQRLVVAGQDGFDVGPGQGSEGGDIYLWAGQGGGQFGSGGDIKVDAGNAAYNGSGGTIKVRGGHANGPSGESGGFIQIESGSSNTGSGGYVHVLAGDSDSGYGGSAQLAGGFSNNNNGGQVSVLAGSSYSGNGGDVSIQAGRSFTSDAGGDVNIQTYGSGDINLTGHDVNTTATNFVGITSGGAMNLTANGGDMNFYMDGGMYIGVSDSNNQIIKRSDLNALPQSYFQAVRWTPSFTADGLTFTGTDTTHPAYQSYYVKQGQLVSFWIAVDCATVTNFGTGQLKLSLPFDPLPGTMNHFSGWVNVDETANPDLAGHIIVNADHLQNTSVLDLHYIKQSGGANSPVMEAMLMQNTPVVLTTNTNIYVNGTYIAL